MLGANTKATVLVVEDERPVRDLLRLHLENAGYSVITAADAVIAGKVFIERIREIDLLVVDAHLPYMTGIEFVSTVIADTTLPPVPMILITGHETLAVRAAVLDVPCLFKPFSAADLLSVVARSLGSSGVPSTARPKEPHDLRPLGAA